MGSKSQKTGILVLGMPDSLTSAVSGVLGSLGCDLASGTGPGGDAISAFNDELMASAGSSSDDFTPFHSDWMQSPQAPDFLARADALLEQEFGQSRLFALSDPKIGRLLPFWIEALKRFGCAPNAILTTGSLAGETGKPLDQILWLRQALDSEHGTRELPRLPVSLQQMQSDWIGVARKIQESFGLTWPKSAASAEFEVASLLGDLHAGEGASSLSPKWIVETQSIMDSWASTGQSEPDRAALDRIREEFDVAAFAFGRVVRSAVANAVRKPSPGSRRPGVAPIRAESDVEKLKTSLQEERRRNTMLNAEIQQQVENREGVEALLFEAQAEITAHRDRRKEMARVITNREGKIERLTKELADRYQELATLQRQIVRSNPVWLARAGFRKVARAARG